MKHSSLERTFCEHNSANKESSAWFATADPENICCDADDLRSFPLARETESLPLSRAPLSCINAWRHKWREERRAEERMRYECGGWKVKREKRMALGRDIGGWLENGMTREEVCGEGGVTSQRESGWNVVGSYQHNVDTKLLASSKSFEVSEEGGGGGAVGLLEYGNLWTGGRRNGWNWNGTTRRNRRPRGFPNPTKD